MSVQTNPEENSNGISGERNSVSLRLSTSQTSSDNRRIKVPMRKMADIRHIGKHLIYGWIRIGCGFMDVVEMPGKYRRRKRTIRKETRNHQMEVASCFVL